MASRPIVSIVIPVYNEEHNINALIESVEKTLSDYSYELIFVDDFQPITHVKSLKNIQIHTKFLLLLNVIKGKALH